MELKDLIDQIYDTAVAHRRWLHAHPEVSGQEKNTAAYIAETLRKIGLNPTENVGGYGVTALIQGCRPGKPNLQKPLPTGCRGRCHCPDRRAQDRKRSRTGTHTSSYS